MSDTDIRTTSFILAEDELLTALTGLTQLRSFYAQDTRELFGVLLNATSAAEANLSLEVLRGLVPEKPLVTACNLREVIREFPVSPFPMHADEKSLIRELGFERDIAVLRKPLPDGIELCITTAGTLVLDVIVDAGSARHYWSPIPIDYEFVNPKVVHMLMSSEYLLEAVIDLVKAMGLVFNPKFYLSLEDFHLEYAAETIHDLDELF